MRNHVSFLPLFAAAGVLTLTACTTVKESAPARTATEELLISSAADRAAEDLAKQTPVGRKTFIDTTYFDEPDGKYAIAAIREALARHGAILSDQKTADVIVEIRAGALSLDQHSVLIGLPAFTLPLPFTGPVTTPEIALYRDKTTVAKAKFGALSYERETGKRIASEPPTLQVADQHDYVLMILIGWSHDTMLPAKGSRPPEADNDLP
jgi:hypothetical protein